MFACAHNEQEREAIRNASDSLSAISNASESCDPNPSRSAVTSI